MRAHLTALLSVWLVAACAGPAAPASAPPPRPLAPPATPEVTTPTVTPGPAAMEPASSDEPPALWLPWQPCGCLEGCAFIEEGRGSLREGMGVTVVRANVRDGARPLAAGTVALVERAETTDGVGMFVLSTAGPAGPDGTPGPVICSYLCETRYSGPLAPDTCASGTL